MRTGPAFPRTRRTQTDPMFPQFPGRDYVEPDLRRKFNDAVVLIAAIGVVGAVIVLGGVFYGAL